MRTAGLALLLFPLLDGFVKAGEPTPFSKLAVDTCRLDDSMPPAVLAALATAWDSASSTYPNASKSAIVTERPTAEITIASNSSCEAR